MELPREIPVMTLPNAILFPQAPLPLYIFEPRYRQMLADALATHRMFCVAMRRSGRTRETPAGVAGLGLIRAARTREDGTSHLLLQGIARVELAEAVRYRPYRVHRIRPLAAMKGDNVAIDALTAKVLELVAERLGQAPQLPTDLLKNLGKMVAPSDVTPDFADMEGSALLAKLNDPGQIADLISWVLLPSPRERQLLLETVHVETRLKHLIHFLMAEIQRQRKNTGQ